MLMHTQALQGDIDLAMCLPILSLQLRQHEILSRKTLCTRTRHAIWRHRHVIHVSAFLGISTLCSTEPQTSRRARHSLAAETWCDAQAHADFSLAGGSLQLMSDDDNDDNSSEEEEDDDPMNEGGMLDDQPSSSAADSDDSDAAGETVSTNTSVHHTQMTPGCM